VFSPQAGGLCHKQKRRGEFSAPGVTSNFDYVKTILSPSLSVTMAFFQSGDLPAFIAPYRRTQAVAGHSG
jgi:hypothetical protein